MVALVGPSGAGKTTITHLVARLYDVTAAPSRRRPRRPRRDPESLEDAVGYVTQDAHMFHDTHPRQPALCAAGRHGRARSGTALDAAQIAQPVGALPDGLDTVVGDRGYRLSGGERQRLAIARLLLKAPSIVVLDEATAHLDSESEAAVQGALDPALEGRTSLVIAHRLSTVRSADRILVVDDGRVVEPAPTPSCSPRAGSTPTSTTPSSRGRAADRPVDRLTAMATWISDSRTGSTSSPAAPAASAGPPPRCLVAEGAKVVLSGRDRGALDAAVAELGDARRGRRRRQRRPATRRAPDRRGPRHLGPPRRRADQSVGGPAGGPGHRASPTSSGPPAFESVFLGAVRLAARSAASSARAARSPSCSRRACEAPLTGLAISNGLRPGLAMVAKTLADELGPRGVRVNGLLPGRVDTDRVAELDAPTGDPEAARRRDREPIPLGATAARGVRAGRRLPALAGGVVRQRRDGAGRRRMLAF